MAKLPIRSMLNSKRFFAACGATVCFVIMVYTTAYPPLEIAGAITMILGAYLGAQSYRGSNMQKDNNNDN